MFVLDANGRAESKPLLSLADIAKITEDKKDDSTGSTDGTDDGTTDTLDRVTHNFSPGTHTVTLVAMLGGGICTDTVSETFTVDMPSDTAAVTARTAAPG